MRPTISNVRRRFTRHNILLPPARRILWMVNDVVNGSAKYNNVTGVGVIVIPMHAFDKEMGGHTRYVEYYITHELCHIATAYGGKHHEHHGANFYNMFYKVSHPSTFVYEWGYKPYASIRYGPPSIREVFRTIRGSTTHESTRS